MSYTSPDKPLFYAKANLPTAVVRRLKRGQLSLEARCDLHGFTRADAVDEMLDFIEGCARANKKAVLLIHGKGAVLKDCVDETLRFMPEVLAFCSATPKHGGTGAIYILLKSNVKNKDE